MSKVIDVKHTTSEVLDLMIEHIYAWRCIHATEKSYTVSVSYTTYPTQWNACNIFPLTLVIKQQHSLFLLRALLLVKVVLFSTLHVVHGFPFDLIAFKIL